jgi:hypothetical protein
MGDAAIELETDHRCLLAELTDRLATLAARHRGASLANHAASELDAVLVKGRFETCCLPRYLALAPKSFERELQVPVASADVAELDTRVLLWPVGARDLDHPHVEGWTVFAAVRGDLVLSEVREGERRPERRAALRRSEVLMPEEDVVHHVRNRGHEIGVSVHVFGR